MKCRLLASQSLSVPHARLGEALTVDGSPSLEEPPGHAARSFRCWRQEQAVHDHAVIMILLTR